MTDVYESEHAVCQKCGGTEYADTDNYRCADCGGPME